MELTVLRHGRDVHVHPYGTSSARAASVSDDVTVWKATHARTPSEHNVACSAGGRLCISTAHEQFDLVGGQSAVVLACAAVPCESPVR